MKKRYELKYLITYDQYLSISNKLSTVMTLDEHANEYGNYTINSLYFDDIYSSAASDKLFGESIHKKFRIRSYNTNESKLELKVKKGNITKKDSIYIDNYNLISILNNDLTCLYSNTDNIVVNEFIKSTKLRHLQPILYVKYDREAYIDKSFDIRITFDKNLQAQRYYTDYKDIPYDIIPSSYMILEVKYTNYLPKSIEYILNTNKLHQVSYSKYGKAYTTLIY